jgi:plastocyanin
MEVWMTHSRTSGVVAAMAALALTAVPVFAQDEAPAEPMDTMAEEMTVEVTGVEYAFAGLPETLEVGSEITFTNEGAELHEIVLVRKADGVTESIEELLAMEAEGRDPMAEGLVEMVGEGPLIAMPGMTAEDSLVLDQPGEYVALCFIPQGFDPAAFEAAGLPIEEMGPEFDPSTAPEEIQAIFANPPHIAAGMIQPFTVVEAEEEAAA